MKNLCLALVAASIICLGNVQQASALPDFFKEFKKKYVEPSENEEFKKAATKARCNLCHVKGKPKKMNNKYGEALSKLIEGSAKQRLADAGDDGKAAEKEKLSAELKKAFKEVEKVKAPNGELYGARLKAGQLPFAP